MAANAAASSSDVDPDVVVEFLERRRRDLLDQLTPREREVLALMAEGLSDRGIALRLYLTTKTVETHVRHIIAKLRLPGSALHNRRVQAVLTYRAAAAARRSATGQT